MIAACPAAQRRGEVVDGAGGLDCGSSDTPGYNKSFEVLFEGFRQRRGDATW